MGEYEFIPTADLQFDTLNPRLGRPSGGQREILSALAKEQNEKLRYLAADILAFGVNPSDIPIVVRTSGGRYTVLEGNRRLTAIRVLENPDSVADSVSPSVLRVLRQLSKDYLNNPIPEEMCYVVNDREEAEHWIELKHTGERLGAGTIHWTSEERSRFGQRGGVTPLNIQALDFLEQRGVVTPEQRRKLSVTTLRRLLGTPDFRQRVGLDLKQGQLVRVASDAAVAKALGWVVKEMLAGNVPVSRVYDQDARKRFAASIPDGIAVTKPTRATAKGSGATATAAAANSAASGKSARSTATVRDRDHLIPTTCVLDVTDTRLQIIERELRGISLRDYPNAVAVLFRVFVELSADAYMTKHSLPTSDQMRLHQKILDVTADLVSQKRLTPDQAAPARKMAQRSSFLGTTVTLMNSWVHNHHMFPSGDELRTGWDNMQPWFTAVWSV